ncbi:MAG: FtsW/RodA/SpoVE family cell cycle protein [Lentimicrobiaceae bacterium]|nr:FtsW/RodA/SpoVE family cell cycle protein [Lentimicrobiaceae bacterium]
MESKIEKIRAFIRKDKGDRVIWIVAVLLCIVSVLAVYSTGSKLGDPYHKESLWFLFRQHVLFLLAGIGIMYVFSQFNYRLLGKFSRIFLIIAVVLFILTIALGISVSGAKRSISIFGIEFQTIHAIEVLFVIFMAQWIAKVRNNINDWKRVYVPMLVFVGAMCAMIGTQKTSAGIILGVTCMVLLFSSQLSGKHIALTVLFGSLLIGLLVAVLFVSSVGHKAEDFGRTGTAMSRVERFFNKEDAHRETILTEAAIATGGLGFKPGNSVQADSIGQSYSDYIYASIVEEYGLLVGAFVVLLYLTLFYRIYKITQYIQSSFGMYLALGLGFLIVFQALTHISVCTGLFPTTGETLPLVSRGGTSILITSLCFAVLLNLSIEAKKDKKKLKMSEL